MGNYRDEARVIHKEVRWTIWKFLLIFIGVVVLLAVLGFGLRSMGLLGGTIVERKVFEESYQRSESLKSRIAVDEAALVEITSKLSNPNLDANTRYNLEAQASAARVRINTVRNMK